MRLPKHVIASRKNGARSRGPKTEEGKRLSSLNAIRHGLLSKGIVLKNESETVFSELLAQHLGKLAPADDVEHCAVEEMAASVWRLRRLWAIEKQLFDSGLDKRSETTETERIAATFSDLAARPELHLLDRYETKLHRMYQRSLHNLLILRELGSPDLDSPPEDNGPSPGPIAETTDFQTNLFPCNLLEKKE